MASFPILSSRSFTDPQYFFGVPRYALVVASPVKCQTNMPPVRMHSLYQIRLLNELCVNLKADFAIVRDSERNVAGYGPMVRGSFRILLKN